MQRDSNHLGIYSKKNGLYFLGIPEGAHILFPRYLSALFPTPSVRKGTVGNKRGKVPLVIQEGIPTVPFSALFPTCEGCISGDDHKITFSPVRRSAG